MKRSNKRIESITQDDTLEMILSFVDLATLSNCLVVCKSWNSIINSHTFRHLWCRNAGVKETPQILTSVPGSEYTSWCLYAFGESGHKRELKLPPLRKPYTFARIKASAGGLLCAFCLPPQARPKYHFLVGNPLTCEWMEIPALQWKDAEEATMDFAMFVDDASGFFKLGVHCAVATGHTGYVYDSATQAWSALGMLHFSQAYIKVRTKREELCNMNLIPTFPEMDDFYYDITTLGMYDIQRCEWSVGSVVRSLKFTTGCEGQFEAGKGEFDSHVCCVLPQPGLSTSRLWEYNGQRYFASAWVYAGVTCDRDDGVDGFGVWTVENNGSLVAVSAVCVTYAIKDPKRQYYMLQVMTAADGNLVCFSDDAPVVVYNLNTDKWCEIEPPQLTDRFNETVVYRSSLRRVA